MENYNNPVKCPDCTVWWRGETHKCLITVTASLVKNITVEQLEITDEKTKERRHKIAAKNSNRNWTPSEDSYLKSLEKQAPQLSHKEIGQIMGRSPRSIERRLRDLRKTNV